MKISNILSEAYIHPSIIERDYAEKFLNFVASEYKKHSPKDLRNGDVKDAIKYIYRLTDDFAKTRDGNSYFKNNKVAQEVFENALKKLL